MIRRGFWLTAGAVTGIYAYRRASAIGRRLSARLNPAGPGTGETGATQAARLARQGRRGAIGVAHETFRFARDVREGMELYTARHSAPAGSTLGPRDLEQAQSLEGSDQTNHDPRPKDGH
jgi:phytoene/squalene synthetase